MDGPSIFYYVIYNIKFICCCDYDLFALSLAQYQKLKRDIVDKVASTQEEARGSTQEAGGGRKLKARWQLLKREGVEN